MKCTNIQERYLVGRSFHPKKTSSVTDSMCEDGRPLLRVADLKDVTRTSEPHKKYVNIPSGKYIYVHKYVYICVYTYLCKMDEYRYNAGLS